MEPKIRVRRAEVRKQEGRRRLRVVVALLVCLGVATAVWGATQSPLLDVDRIVVEGAARTGSAATIKASGVSRGTGMVDVEEQAVERRLRALPWVRSASVRREWPGTLRLSVLERTPVAITANLGGSWAVVDTQGRVLAWEATPVPGLLVLGGLDAAGAPGATLAPAARGLLDVARAVPSGLRPLISGATIGVDGISLGLVPEGRILLGEADALAEKLRAAQLVLEGVETSDLGVLDVRLPATPTVTRSQS